MLLTEGELRGLVESALGDSTVLLHVDGKPEGSGFFISEQGHIATCRHCFKPLLNTRCEGTWRT
ncbi:MAG TPA: hypothetical protein VK176_04410, partial [Phycisphaerales bacterium]|nr:hypothetical protein [Phycisphaerales bacterium]